ncbi:MAG: hypothetical protein ACT4QC_05060 [Planctomycetaceae bacterium]
MSRKSMGKTTDEVYLDLFEQYRKLHPGAVRMEDVGLWIENQRLLPSPRVSAASIHTRKLKQAARRKRMKDGKGRTVREWLAVKVERMTANGQKVFDVIWDQLHEMSLDHALSAFGQRDDVIAKQKRSATRDVESCLDFNPNVKGHEDQFLFAFMDEAPVPVVTEKIGETDFLPPSETPSDPRRIPR